MAEASLLQLLPLILGGIQASSAGSRGRSFGDLTGSKGGDAGLLAGLAATGFGLPIAAGLGLGFLDGGNEQEAKILQTNPAMAVLANLFNVGASVEGEGGVMLNPGPARQFATPLDFGPLSRFLNAPTSGLDLQAEGVAERALGRVPGVVGNLEDLARATSGLAQETIGTGLPTDVSGIFDAARSRFLNDLVPTAFASGGRFSLSDSVTRDRIGALAARTAEEQARVQASVDEAASNRRILGGTQLAPTAAGLRTSAVSFPLAAASDAQGIAARRRAADPGARLLDFLTRALGAGNSTITQGPGTGSAGVTAALSQVPAAFPALANLFGGGGGGVTASGSTQLPPIAPPVSPLMSENRTGFPFQFA